MTPVITKDPAKIASVRELQQGDFRRNFEKQSFAFSHEFANNPLFQVDAILEQAKAHPKGVYFDAGDIRVTDRWDQAPERRFTAEDAIRNIHNAGAWVFLNNVERNPEYGRVLDQFFQQAEELAGRPFRRTIRSQEMIIFLTSPNRVTPYHIDRECNFLLQTSGTKVIHTFDGTDRSILSEEELERFWAYDKNAAQYKESHQEKARSFQLTPGNGVHIPVNFPHWVRNGDNVSISVSISVQFQDMARANLYRANHFLRRHGVVPSSPGQAPWRDAVKTNLYTHSRRVLDALRPKRDLN